MTENKKVLESIKFVRCVFHMIVDVSTNNLFFWSGLSMFL